MELPFGVRQFDARLEKTIKKPGSLFMQIFKDRLGKNMDKGRRFEQRW